MPSEFDGVNFPDVPEDIKDERKMKEFLENNIGALGYLLRRLKYFYSIFNTVKHNRQHSINSTSDHTSTITSGKIIIADANGLPSEGTNTDTEVKNAVDVSSNVMEKVSEVNVSSDCTYVDFTGLDGDDEQPYLIYCNIKNPTTGAVGYNLFVNGDTIETNYYYQQILIDGTNSSPARGNHARILSVPASQAGFAEATILKDVNGYYRAISSQSRDVGSNVKLMLGTVCKTGTITNITSLRLSATATGGIGAGSRITLFKVRRA